MSRLVCNNVITIIDHYKKSAFLSHLSISMAGIHTWKGVLGSQILGYDGNQKDLQGLKGGFSKLSMCLTLDLTRITMS